MAVECDGVALNPNELHAVVAIVQAVAKCKGEEQEDTGDDDLGTITPLRTIEDNFFFFLHSIDVYYFTNHSL